MSVRVIWEVASCPVRLAGKGERMPDGQVTDSPALVLGDGLGAQVVIEGTVEGLADFVTRVANAVDTTPVAFRSTRARDRVWQLTDKGILATSRLEPPPAA